MKDWLKYRSLFLELFIISNLSFLAVDIYVAHSTNDFFHIAEWIPFYFSLLAPIFLIIEIVLNRKIPNKNYKISGFVVGAVSVLIGIVGLFYHLHDTFFQYQTIKSLVYTAPFIAPLAYTGLGCLIIMNRMIKHDEIEWSHWLIFFSMGGFFGNFILAVCDHAQNGFFYITEWIPVVSSAIAVSFLGVLIMTKNSITFLQLCLWVMGAQMFVGMLGFYFHGVSATSGQASNFFENLVYAAPIFAPLLFVNLAILAIFGLVSMKTIMLDSK